MVTVKKVAKAKSPAKATKASASHKNQKRVLARAQGEQCFWVKNGVILADLVELSNALKVMDGEVFAHHVNKKQNHFADWIEYVLGDSELAATIRNVKTAKSFNTIVVRRLKAYAI